MHCHIWLHAKNREASKYKGSWGFLFCFPLFSIQRTWQPARKFLQRVSGGVAPLAPSREHCPLHPHQTLAARQRGKSLICPLRGSLWGCNASRGKGLRPPASLSSRLWRSGTGRPPFRCHAVLLSMGAERDCQGVRSTAACWRLPLDCPAHRVVAKPRNWGGGIYRTPVINPLISPLATPPGGAHVLQKRFWACEGSPIYPRGLKTLIGGSVASEGVSECALMSVSNLPFETQVLMPPDGGKWITKNQ